MPLWGNSSILVDDPIATATGLRGRVPFRGAPHEIHQVASLEVPVCDVKHVVAASEPDVILLLVTHNDRRRSNARVSLDVVIITAPALMKGLDADAAAAAISQGELDLVALLELGSSVKDVLRRMAPRYERQRARRAQVSSVHSRLG